MSDPSHCQRNASANAFLVVSSITLAIASIVVPLRIYVRLKLVKFFGWDDACILISFAIAIPTFALLYETVRLGMGKHIGCMPYSDSVTLGKYQYVAEVLEIYCVIFARLSASLFVIRLFAVTSRLKNFLYGYAVFMTLALGVTGILVLLQCRPAAALWDITISGQCWSPTVRSFIDNFNGAVSILSDFLLAALPVYFLWTVQMSVRLKIAVCSLMALSAVPGICATARTALAYTQTSSDPIYSFAILIVFGSLETTMAIICTTIPALSPLFSERRRKRFTEPNIYGVSGMGTARLPSKHTQHPSSRASERDTIDTTPLVPLGGISVSKTVELSVT